MIIRAVERLISLQFISLNVVGKARFPLDDIFRARPFSPSGKRV